jgi:DNA-binding NtrC family response regulator/predicted hydrocarbon binding protein
MARGSRRASKRASTEHNLGGVPSVSRDIDDLRALFRFFPTDGRIWLGDVRVALVHVPALAALRRELIDRFGIETARGLFTRMGYESGARDAELARKVRRGASLYDAFAVGPQIHSFEGMVHVDVVRFEVDPARGYARGEALWRNSAEVDCHLSCYGISPEPVCWMQTGYACGYTTAFIGRPILVREVECRATGAADCRIVAKPVEEWGEAPDDLRFLHPEGFLQPAARAPDQPLTTSLPTVPASGLLADVVGASSGFNAVCRKLERVADTTATVLFLGETGVGKEIFARTLHRAGARAAGPFVAVNCAAIPETLIESELFGVEKGAFTGAVASRPGRFERADGGTLFLDEVGTLNLAAQAKLLRALQTGEIERVGDVRARHVDVRVVAATNEDLEKRVREGAFRSDLFYRLNVFPIVIPPLRERHDDIPLLARHFLERYAARHGRRIPGFTGRALSALLDYDYPGNIRELENIIERAVILSEHDRPLDVYLLFPSGRPAERALALDDEGHLAAERRNAGAAADLGSIAGSLLERGVAIDDLVTALMRQAVEQAGGNMSAAAKRVGVTRAQIVYRLRKTRRH